MTATDIPPPEGVRQPWSAVAPHVRNALQSWWGRSVERAVSQPAGFSPGVAVRLRATDGSGLFVKAISSEPNPYAPSLHRREIEIASRLPADAPAPRLRWWFDEGEPGWVVLAFDEIAGDNPVTPWRPAEIDRVVAALDDLSARLTPSPLPPESAGNASEAFANWICGWRRLRDDTATHKPLDLWSRRHLTHLAELEAGAGEAAQGDTLLHCDLRADNMVLTADRVWFVDWPHAQIGAAWIDPVLLAPSVAMQGGPQPEVLLSRLPSYREADSDGVTAVVAALAGFFTHRSLQPPPPGLPTVRAFQAAQAAVARGWLADRLGWELP